MVLSKTYTDPLFLQCAGQSLPVFPNMISKDSMEEEKWAVLVFINMYADSHEVTYVKVDTELNCQIIQRCGKITKKSIPHTHTSLTTYDSQAIAESVGACYLLNAQGDMPLNKKLPLTVEYMGLARTKAHFGINKRVINRICQEIPNCHISYGYENTRDKYIEKVHYYRTDVIQQYLEENGEI